MPRQLTNWIDSYMNYLSDSEAPRQYNYWSAMSALGSVCKRNVWYEHGTYKIYLNQYIVLVGPPGIGKGTAINPMVDLIKETKLGHHLSDRITAEKIIEKLAAGFQTVLTSSNGTISMVPESCATIVSTELPIFIGASDWMLPLLCELWDGKGLEYDTRHKGTYTIKNSSVGLIGGCVPDFIRKLNKDATAPVTGGFTARTVFVHASKRGQSIPFPQKISIKQKLRDQLMHDLAHVSQLQGEFTFDKNARMIYDMLHHKYNKPEDFESEVLANFRSRMTIHMRKVAMALSISESDNLIITETNLNNAIKLVENIFEKLDVIFRGVGESPLAFGQGKVCDFIEKSGLVSRTEILKAVRRDMTTEDLDRILYILEEAALIERCNQGVKVMYKWRK